MPKYNRKEERDGDGELCILEGTALEEDETVPKESVKPSLCLVLVMLRVIVIEFHRAGIREG